MINCVFGNGLHVFYGMLIDLQYDLGNSPSRCDPKVMELFVIKLGQLLCNCLV